MVAALQREMHGLDVSWNTPDGGMFLWVRMMAAFFESVDEFREEMRRHVPDELGDTSAEQHVPVNRIGRIIHPAQPAGD